MNKVLFILLAICSAFVQGTADVPKHVRQCSRNDPLIKDCIIKGIIHLKPYLQRGLPEIGLPSTEPFLLDSMSIQLTGGPSPYKITLKNIEVKGLGYFDVKDLFIGKNNYFRIKFAATKLQINAKYNSSGTLLILPSTGGGDFYGLLENSIIILNGTISNINKESGTYLNFNDDLKLNFKPEKVFFNVKKSQQQNHVLVEAMNLFLKQNGLEVFHLIRQQLQTKLVVEIKKILDKLSKSIPLEQFYTD